MTPETFIKRFALATPTPYRVEPAPQDTGLKPRYRVWRQAQEGCSFYAVKDIEEAKQVIDALVQTDLVDEDVVWNAFGLEEFEADGKYHEWYNDWGESITDLADEES